MCVVIPIVIRGSVALKSITIADVLEVALNLNARETNGQLIMTWIGYGSKLVLACSKCATVSLLGTTKVAGTKEPDGHVDHCCDVAAQTDYFLWAKAE